MSAFVSIRSKEADPQVGSKQERVKKALADAYGIGGPPKIRPLGKNSKITVDTIACKTIPLFDEATDSMAKKTPLPQGCFNLDILTRVQGPFEYQTTQQGDNYFTYALIEDPKRGRVWLVQNHVEIYPDSVKPSLPARPNRLTAEEFVRSYNDAQFQDDDVIITGFVSSANFAVITMRSGSMILEFSSAGMAGVADFSRVPTKGQQISIKGKCLGRGLKDTQRFLFENCKIVSPTKPR